MKASACDAIQVKAAAPGKQPGEAGPAKRSSSARRAPSPQGGKAPAWNSSPAKGPLTGEQATSGKAASPGRASLAAAKGLCWLRLLLPVSLPFAAADGVARILLVFLDQVICVSLNTQQKLYMENMQAVSMQDVLLVFHGTCMTVASTRNLFHVPSHAVMVTTHSETIKVVIIIIIFIVFHCNCLDQQGSGSRLA